MTIDTSGLWKFLVSLLSFPLYFQDAFLKFAWGTHDEFWIMFAKRTLLLLPVLGILLGCWATVACLSTVIIRAKRQEYVTNLLVTWWDFGRSVFAFWGGILRFTLLFLGTVVGFLKLLVVGFWIFLHDILMIPFRVLAHIGQNVISPGFPWIAVVLTMFWCAIEAGIFTYVTSPLVMDTFSNLTGSQLSEAWIRLPLFPFMFIIVLGSYAVLSTWSEALQTKQFANIFKISVIEGVVCLVEVVFLYREFVSSLEPWFAQYASSQFELGIAGTLLISSVAWVGIRSVSWILFASHGTPMIMSIIQGTGLRSSSMVERLKNSPDKFAFTLALIQRLKDEKAWIQKNGDDLLGAFILPPLQVVAGAVNFCTLLIIRKHLFDLPFKGVKELMEAKSLMSKVGRKLDKAS